MIMNGFQCLRLVICEINSLCFKDLHLIHAIHCRIVVAYAHADRCILVFCTKRGDTGRDKRINDRCIDTRDC